MISVIIPYYQKKTGILAKALASIEQQITNHPVHVVVIDDASPISAEFDISDKNYQNFTLEVIRQSNGGPASARNTGINKCPEQTQYIAFLDSDDEWSTDHLLRATTALSLGYDFYFTDHYQLNSNIGAFSRAGRINPNEHPLLTSNLENLHEYKGDLLDQIIRGNIIGTSTVVYDFKKFPKNRFRTEFTNAGEDYLFWMEIVHSGAKAAFSNQCEATYGSGVNIYAGTGWGSDGNLLRIHNEIKYKKLTCELFKLNQLQKNHIKLNISNLRESFSKELFHRIFHNKKISYSLLKKHLQVDPLTYLKTPITFINYLFKIKINK